jgi:hypothetical protein
MKKRLEPTSSNIRSIFYILSCICYILCIYDLIYFLFLIYLDKLYINICLMYSDYEKILKELYPDINQQSLDLEVNKHFATWFEKHVRVKLVQLSLFFIC